MPTAALHSQYWQTQSAPAAGAEAPSGYPIWQASVICGSGFGASQIVWEWVRDRVVTTTQEQR